jgi:hypothetical protein
VNYYNIKIHFLEFLSIHRNANGSSDNSSDRPEAVYFRSYLDGDRSGFLDVEEIAKWVEPAGFVQVRRTSLCRNGRHQNKKFKYIFK